MINTLDLAGEYTGLENLETHTVRLSFELAEDAEKVAKIVGAKPETPDEQCASLATFNYSRRLYEGRLSAIRAKCISEVKAAILRGEG